MSRISKLMLFAGVLIFALACNFVTQPIDQAQQVVETVQSLATALPIETLQSFTTEVPLSTLEALPSAMPDLGNVIDPQGEPLSEWNGIPVMPSATTGGEASGIYSYKTDASVSEVFEYYKTEMSTLGWEEFFSTPDTGSGAFLTFEKDNSLATITITTDGEGALVFLASQ